MPSGIPRTTAAVDDRAAGAFARPVTGRGRGGAAEGALDVMGMTSEGTNGSNGEARPRIRDIVSIRDLHKSFGDTEVLKGIDLVCLRGETTCIVGGSGAGKTTLLRLVVGLDRPTSGHIFIDGEDIAPMGERDLNRVRQKFGMVYQYAALLDSITVLDNVAFPLIEHTKLSSGERRAKVIEKLKALDLDESVLKKFPAELSGGMRKRVGLARALMLDPPILVYDEPTSGLDPMTSRTVDDLIDQTRRQFGVTSIVITHDITSCFRIADQAILLVDGAIVARGAPPELAHGESPLAREFIAKSGVDVDAIASHRGG
jgi:phospholipid/cholesterol/gamma-HCH transport system ATP-binding protein